MKVLHTSRVCNPANLKVSSTGGPVKATSTETVEDVDVEPEGSRDASSRVISLLKN